MLENCDHKAIDPQASRRVSRARNGSKDSEKLKEKRRKNEDRTRIILFKSWFSHVRIVTSHLRLVTSHVRILKFTEQRETKRGEERGGERNGHAVSLAEETRNEHKARMGSEETACAGESIAMKKLNR